MRCNFDPDSVLISPGVRGNFPIPEVTDAVFRHADGDPGDNLTDDEIMELLSADLNGNPVFSRFQYGDKKATIICMSTNDRRQTHIFTPDEYGWVQRETGVTGHPLPGTNKH
jgi:hypothetical protein